MDIPNMYDKIIVMSKETEQLCPAAIEPMFEGTDSNIAVVNADQTDPFCYCEAGPQRMQLEIGGVALPFKDPRAGKSLCGKTLDELDN